MRKGCFVKIIVILTILTAAVLYIVQTKFNDWFLTPGKNFIKSVLNENIDEKLNFVSAGPGKDSLRIILNNFIDSINSVDQISEEQLNRIKYFIEDAAADSMIESEELHDLKVLLKNVRAQKEQ